MTAVLGVPFSMKMKAVALKLLNTYLETQHRQALMEYLELPPPPPPPLHEPSCLSIATS